MHYATLILQKAYQVLIFDCREEQALLGSTEDLVIR